MDSARRGGFLIVHLISQTEAPACIGVEFGRLDKNDQVLRNTIDVDEWLTDPENPLYAGVYAANFDEAWRIVCLLGLMLHTVGVQISYGD